MCSLHNSVTKFVSTTSVINVHIVHITEQNKNVLFLDNKTFSIFECGVTFGALKQQFYNQNQNVHIYKHKTTTAIGAQLQIYW